MPVVAEGKGGVTHPYTTPSAHACRRQLISAALRAQRRIVLSVCKISISLWSSLYRITVEDGYLDYGDGDDDIQYGYGYGYEVRAEQLTICPCLNVASQNVCLFLFFCKLTAVFRDIDNYLILSLYISPSLDVPLCLCDVIWPLSVRRGSLQPFDPRRWRWTRWRDTE